MAEDEGTPPGHVASQPSRGVDASASSDSSLDATVQGKPCRIHLVGVLVTSNGATEVHLGPWTAPASAEQDPSLLDFAIAIKKLIRIAAGHDTWWRFEYMCYGNPVPILSDDALREAFNYFRDQTQALSPAAAAEACRLYLKPTAQSPPWTLQDYLAEPQVMFGLQQTLTPTASGALHLNNASKLPLDNITNPSPPPLNRTYSNTQSEQGLLGQPAGAKSLGEAAAAGRGDGGASSSSSSHEVPQQQQQQQQAAEPDSGMQIAGSAAQLLPADSHGKVVQPSGMRRVPHQVSFTKQPRQQQQQGPALASAFANSQHHDHLQHGAGIDGDDDDGRSSKMPKRSNSSSPRAQWLYEQQHQQPLDSQEQDLQQQQSAEPIVSAALLTPFGAAAAAAATPTLQQQLQQQATYDPMPNTQQGVATTAATPGGTSADNSGELPLAGSFGSLDQLQLLHLSSGNLSNLAGIYGNTLPAGLNGMALAGGLGLLQSAPLGDAASTNHLQQQQHIWNLLSKQQQQQQAGQILAAAAAAAMDPQPTAAPFTLTSIKPGPAVSGLPGLQQSVQGGDAGSTAAAAAGSTTSGDATRADLQLAVAASRAKSETKTKYADGRFKDETRHQQRLSDMKSRCDALFGGAIQEHFQIEHHKRVTCLVCNSTVVPYEAYHIDAVRKHFVRHHEAWLVKAGVDVDLWRKSCAPISKFTGSAAAGGRGGGAAAAGAAGSGEAGAAAAGAGDDDGANARKASSTRLPDGRYRDPQQHQQRLLEMHNRCASLFGGTMTQHWSILNHKCISCHLCQQNITPYAAYHPDCLRKHFVRRHEDILITAGVDVASWSKGIPLGRRKLKALLQQQQSLVQPQQQALIQPQLLLQGPQQQQIPDEIQHGAVAPGADQGLLLSVGAQQQGQQGAEVTMATPRPLWSFLHAARLQQQAQQQQQSQLSAVGNTSSSGAMTLMSLPVSLGAAMEQQQPQQLQPQTQQQKRQLAAVTFASPALQQPLPLSPPIATVHFAADATSPTVIAESDAAQQQALVNRSTAVAAAATGAAAAAAWQPQVSTAANQLMYRDAAATGATGSIPSPRPLQLPPQQLTPHQMPGQQLPPRPQLPLQPQLLPVPMPHQQLPGQPQLPGQQLPPQQQLPGQPQLPGQHARSSGPGLTGMTQLTFSGDTGAKPPVSQPPQHHPHQQQPSSGEWACSMPDVQGFGPMSLSPAIGLAGLAHSLNGASPNSMQRGMGGSMMDVNMANIGSLTEADVAAMWADDDDIACEYDMAHLDSSALADELLKQASLWAAEHR